MKSVTFKGLESSFAKARRSGKGWGSAVAEAMTGQAGEGGRVLRSRRFALSSKGLFSLSDSSSLIYRPLLGNSAIPENSVEHLLPRPFDAAVFKYLQEKAAAETSIGDFAQAVFVSAENTEFSFEVKVVLCFDLYVFRDVSRRNETVQQDHIVSNRFKLERRFPKNAAVVQVFIAGALHKRRKCLKI